MGICSPPFRLTGSQNDQVHTKGTDKSLVVWSSQDVALLIWTNPRLDSLWLFWHMPCKVTGQTDCS